MSTDTDDTTGAQSRSEYHADSDPGTVRQSRARVRAALERNCVGREAAMHGSALAERVPLKATTVRDIIAELRDDPAGPPIGNCGDGYYILSDSAELHEWVSDVKAEIETKRDRLQANVRAFNRRRHGGDGE